MIKAKKINAISTLYRLCPWNPWNLDVVPCDPQLCHAVCCALYFPICTRLLQAVWICVALFTNSSKRANLTNSTQTDPIALCIDGIKPYSTLFNHIKPKERRNMLENCRNLWDQDRSRTLTSFLDFALCPHVSTWSTWSKGTRTEWSEMIWVCDLIRSKAGSLKKTLHGARCTGSTGSKRGVDSKAQVWTKLCSTKV